jgi:uncharacterized membrane protein HdeD (DUF308 family)
MIAPIFASAVLAMVFGIVAQTVLGAENLVAHPWVDSVFWSILIAGVAVSAVQAFLGCRICRTDEGRLRALCREEACR